MRWRSRISIPNVSYKELTLKGTLENALECAQYGRLLEDVAKYACGEGDGLDYTIGNITRRALEAFSRFSYKMSIAFNVDELILDRLGNRSEYFKRSMYRLLLNNESHTEKMVLAMHDELVTFEHLSDGEKQRVSKDVLSLMFVLNEEHVRAYLPTYREKIQSWVDAIPLNDDD